MLPSDLVSLHLGREVRNTVTNESDGELRPEFLDFFSLAVAV